MTSANKAGARIALIAAALAAAAPALAHKDGVRKDDARFSVVAIQDAPLGEALMRRDADTAIDQLTAKAARHGARFAEQNNLCVAYILDKDVDAARSVCETAVSLGERRARTADAWERPRLKRDYAVALTNRGVLRALTGELTEAAQDFEVARRMNRSLKEPRDNLARLAERAPAVVAAR